MLSTPRQMTIHVGGKNPKKLRLVCYSSNCFYKVVDGTSLAQNYRYNSFSYYSYSCSVYIVFIPIIVKTILIFYTLLILFSYTGIVVKPIQL